MCVLCIEEDRNSPALLYCGPLVEGGNCVHRSRVLRFTGIVDFFKMCTSIVLLANLYLPTQASVRTNGNQ